MAGSTPSPVDLCAWRKWGWGGDGLRTRGGATPRRVACSTRWPNFYKYAIIQNIHGLGNTHSEPSTTTPPENPGTAYIYTHIQYIHTYKAADHFILDMERGPRNHDQLWSSRSITKSLVFSHRIFIKSPL